MSRLSRSSESALHALALANTLFFASFIAILLFASTHAQAEDIACTGQDLTKSLSPDVMKTIEAEAAKTINGENRLWKIEKSGQKPSYLFGTMHMTDPRVIDLTAEAKAAYEGSDTVIIETTEVLDQKVAAKALLARPDLMMFTDTTTLSSLVKPDDLPVLEKGLAARGLPLITVNKMKPWMIAGLVALPACELKRKQGGAPFLDIKLAKDAESAGKPINGLETIVEQLDAMASLPMEFHVQGLVETIALGDLTDDVMETMIVLYTQGRIGMIVPLLKHVAPEGKQDDTKYGDFEETMINARNITMATRAEQFLAKGNAFIAVGAMHLPGEKGLVELLRNDGYSLSPLAR